MNTFKIKTKTIEVPEIEFSRPLFFRNLAGNRFYAITDTDELSVYRTNGFAAASCNDKPARSAIEDFAANPQQFTVITELEFHHALDEAQTLIKHKALHELL